MKKLFKLLFLSFLLISCGINKLDNLTNIDLNIQLSEYGVDYFYNCRYFEEHKDGYNILYFEGNQYHNDYKVFETYSSTYNYFTTHYKYEPDDAFLNRLNELKESKFFKKNNLVYFASCLVENKEDIYFTIENVEDVLYINVNVKMNDEFDKNMFFSHFASISKNKIKKYSNIGHKLTVSK